MNTWHATGTVTWKGDLTPLRGEGKGPVIDIGFAVDKYPHDAPPIFTTLKMFGRLAEVCSERIEKGTRLVVEAHFRFQEWEKDGERKSKSFFQVSNMNVLGRMAQSPGGEQPTPEGQTPAAQPVAGESGVPSSDDLPF